MTIKRGYKQKALDEMSFDEALAKIKSIRERRVIFNDRTVRKKQKQAVKRSANNKTKAQKLLAQLSPEQIAFLLKQEA